MKIAFVGDSFCANADVCNGNQDWPYFVAQSLNAEIIQLGHGGKHFFHAVNEFLPKIEEADVIVICVSEPYRIIHNYNLPINLTWVEQMTNKKGDHWKRRQETADNAELPLSKLTDISKATDGYYNLLFEHDLAEFTQICIVSFLDQLLQEHRKKVIWFPCFIHSLLFPFEGKAGRTPIGSDFNKLDRLSSRIVRGPGNTKDFRYQWQYVPASGPVANIPLHELSLAELYQQNMSDSEIEQVIQNDDRRNHFNIDNNRAMAGLLLHVIRISLDKAVGSVSFPLEIIKMEQYFSHMMLGNVRKVL